MSYSRLGAAVLLLFAAGAAAQDAANAPHDENREWERDLHAVVPIGRWNVPDDITVGSTRVIDDATGDPIAGARLLRYTEMTGPEAMLLGATTTDHLGYASLPIHDWRYDCHWLVLADGYAPREGYGVAPDDVIELPRGRSFTFDVVDGMGRPVADARVEAFDGCGHAPTARATRTDANGRFTLDDVDELTIVWIQHPDAAPEYIQIGDVLTLGAHRRIVLPVGLPVEGVVTDPAGASLRGVEVRQIGENRGPAALTGDDGRFRLDGVRAGEPLTFVHPLAEGRWLTIDGDAWLPGVPLRVALTPWGRAEDVDGDGDVDDEPDAAWSDVTVHVADRDGRPVPNAEVSLLRRADGRVVTEYTSDEDADPDDPPTGVAAFRVPPGTWEVVSRTPFSTHEVNAPAFTVGGEARTVEATATPRPRLRLDGWVEEGAHLALAAPGHDRPVYEGEWDDDDAALRVPAEGPVVLRVEIGDRTWFCPAGDVQQASGGGLRIVQVDVPAPHEILLPLGDVAGVTLLHDGRECAFEESNDILSTYADGALLLRLTVDGGDVLEFDVELAGDEGHLVDLRAADERSLPPAEVVVRLTHELPERVDLEIAGADVLLHDHSAHLSAPGTYTLAARGDVVVRARREGHATLRIPATAPCEVRLEWGDATIEVDVVEEDGDPFEALILVDGEPVEGPQGDLTTTGSTRVAGLTAGAHTIAVIPTERHLVGREIRVLLDAGQTRRIRAVLRVRD